MAKGKNGSTGGNRGRSAKTGRFVKQSVKRHPDTTVNESTKKKKCDHVREAGRCRAVPPSSRSASPTVRP